MRTLFLLLTPLAALTMWGADTNQPIVVSAANAQVGIAPDSLASIYGQQLATQTVSAGNPPWPTALGDMPGVSLIDSGGKSWALPLIFVSPTQMNVWLPPGIATGPGTVQFPFTGLGPGVAAALRIVPVNVQRIAPALFTANGSGSGVVAATAVRVVIPTQIQAAVPVFTCDKPGSCSAVPIDLGIDTPVYLSLYGTGIRGWSMRTNVTVTIGTQTFPAAYAGPQPTIPGLDQVNVPLSLSLRGAGLVNVTITVDGVSSNAGQIFIN
jgi:uncharacterized protein (TIGR03437 family)